MPNQTTIHAGRGSIDGHSAARQRGCPASDELKIAASQPVQERGDPAPRSERGLVDSPMPGKRLINGWTAVRKQFRIWRNRRWMRHLLAYDDHMLADLGLRRKDLLMRRGQYTEDAVMKLLDLAQNPAWRIAGLGAVIVVLWGITAWLRMLAAEVPPLELTGIALIGAALSSCMLPDTRRSWASAIRQHPWYVWIVVAGSMIGSAAFYFAALAYAPAAQVVVISYSWPLLFAIVSDLYSHRRPALLTFFSLFLGLAGVVVMQGLGQAPTLDAWLGYAGGLSAGLCWVGYSLFLQVYSRPITPAYPAFFTVSAALALMLQAGMGGLVWPSSLSAVVACAVLGIGSYGFGYLAWGYVVRNGNPRVVPVLPYAVPAVAAITLVLVGQTRSTLALWTGCVLVLLACTLSTRARPACDRG